MQPSKNLMMKMTRFQVSKIPTMRRRLKEITMPITISLMLQPTISGVHQLTQITVLTLLRVLSTRLEKPRNN